HHRAAGTAEPTQQAPRKIKKTCQARSEGVTQPRQQSEGIRCRPQLKADLYGYGGRVKQGREEIVFRGVEVEDAAAAERRRERHDLAIAEAEYRALRRRDRLPQALQQRTNRRLALGIAV